MTIIQNQKTFIVTGATNGMGLETAKAISQTGANLIIVGRNAERGQKALELIRSHSKNAQVEFMLADLSSMEEVRRLANQIKSKYKTIDVLVNNAGASFASRQETVDGYEMTFALNHLSFFLLTHLLLDELKAAPEGRIINISSYVHAQGKVYLDDLHLTKKYSSYEAYKQSKLCNLLFTYELANRLKDTNVTVNALNPGIVKTNFGSDQWMVVLAMKWFGKTAEQGAETAIHLALAEEVKGITGKYFIKKKDVRSSTLSYNQELQQKLWEISADLTGIQK